MIDYDPDELFAPVPSHESIRALLAVAASKNCFLEGYDVDNAYLFGNLDVPIRMKQPTDSTGIPAKEGHDCFLVKSLYGAKQAGKIWGNEIHQKLKSWKFTQSSVDPRLYYFSHIQDFILICVVVDDVTFCSNSHPMMIQFKENMKASFEVKFYGELQSFIRWKITRTLLTITITQTSYCERLLKRFGMESCNPTRLPLPTNVDLAPRQSHETPLSPEARHTFRAIVGGVSYLAQCTRPDLIFSISALARSLHAPCSRHLSIAKRILRYIRGTMTYGIQFTNKAITYASLRAAVDADWGGCPATRRSTSGYIFAINGAPILWKSKLQPLVTLSPGAAEYVALSACVNDVTWLRRLVFELVCLKACTKESFILPTAIEIDSSAAMSIASNKESSKLTKHISIRFHHVRDHLSFGTISLQKVKTDCQVADCLTKPATTQSLHRIVSTFLTDHNNQEVI